MRRNVFVYADLGRAGLGNLMLTWARAEIFRARHGLAMLAPRWVTPKLGPILRREKDARLYLGQFGSDGYVGGLRRAWVVSRGVEIAEDQAEAYLAQHPHGARGRPALLTFRHFSTTEWFNPLMAHREHLARRIEEMASPEILRRVREQPADFEVAAHVRRGDKPLLAYRSPATQMHHALADEWFINCIASIRKAAGREVRVRVFSDGRPEQIKAILAVPGVVLGPDQPALADILTMAKARTLITTCNSSFSLWAGFLGRMPTLTYPGTLIAMNPDKADYDAEADLEGNITPASASVIRGALNGRVMQ